MIQKVRQAATAPLVGFTDAVDASDDVSGRHILGNHRAGRHVASGADSSPTDDRRVERDDRFILDRRRNLVHEELPDGERAVLLICGDAHQVGHGIDVYRSIPSLARSRRLLRKLDRKLLGDLSGIDVVFGAAYTDRKAKLPAAKEVAVQRFWQDAWAPAVRARSFTYGATPSFPR
jgi:hypothetical protein